MLKSEMTQKDFCEWNPAEGEPSTYAHINGPLPKKIDYYGCQNTSTQIIGHNGKWRLCDSCAALPEFKKYRKRKEIIR